MKGASDGGTAPRDEAADAIANHPWFETPLGPAEAWPASLTSAVDFALGLPLPAAVLWGADLVLVPNARFAGLAGRPSARIGAAMATAWPTGWPGDASVWDAVRSGRTVRVAGMTPAPSLTFAPVRDETGTVAGVLVTAPAHAGESSALLTELQFQSRNALAWMRSIIKRAAATSPDLDSFLMHLDGRIDAFSRVRSSALLQPEGVPLEKVVTDELLAAGAMEDGTLTLNGPEIALRPRAAEAFALAVHELATNALKFGALSVPEGRIAVSWRREGRPERLVFDWVESGLSTAPRIVRQGFGMEVLDRTVPFELGGEARVAAGRGGLAVTIEVDAARLVPAPVGPA